MQGHYVRGSWRHGGGDRCPVYFVPDVKIFFLSLVAIQKNSCTFVLQCKLLCVDKINRSTTHDFHRRYNYPNQTKKNKYVKNNLKNTWSYPVLVYHPPDLIKKRKYLEVPVEW